MKFHHQNVQTFIRFIITRKITCFIIFLIIVPHLYNLNLAIAERSKLSDVESEIIYHTYNTNYESAENLILRQLNGNPDSLKYVFFYLAYNYLKINFVLQDFRTELKEEKMDSANSQLIKYAEKRINQIDPDKLDIENKLFLASIYGYLGQLSGDKGSYLDAFVYGKAGFNYLEEILAEDPTVYDAYFGLGLFEYFVDRYSGVIQFILNIFGIEGNREKGLEYIQIAINRGKYGADAAKLSLISLYIGYEDNEDLAIPLFEEFVKKYPKNGEILNWYCKTLLEKEDYKQFFIINEQDTSDLIDPYFKAWAYHSIGNYVQSNRYLNIVNNTKEHYHFENLEYIEYIHILNNFFLDNRSEDLKLSTLSSEKYREQAHEIINLKDLSKSVFDFIILVRKNNNYHHINDYLTRNPNFSGSIYLRYLYHFYRGVYHFNNDQYATAESIFQKTKSYFQRNSLKYLIKIYELNTTEKENVIQLLEDIETISDNNLAYRSMELRKKYNIQ